MSWSDRILLFVVSMVGGGLLALVANFVSAETNTISSTVSSTVSSSSNTVGTTTVDKTPPTASSPSISIVNSDICKHAGFSGGVQTQVLGISTGGVVVTDELCQLIKLSRAAANTLNLKTVAASIMSQEPRFFLGMWRSNVIPPFNGLMGDQARAAWLANPDKLPEGVTLDLLLTKAELAALEHVDLTESKIIDGHKVCKAKNGNYFMSCS